MTTSSSIGMAQALLGIANPGDEVIVPGPYFASYAQQIELAGGVVVEVPTYEENAYRPDEQELRRVITSAYPGHYYQHTLQSHWRGLRPGHAGNAGRHSQGVRPAGAGG